MLAGLGLYQWRDRIGNGGSFRSESLALLVRNAQLV
jgi:hypothetical protein